MAIMALAGAGKELRVLLFAVTQQDGWEMVLEAQMTCVSQRSSTTDMIYISVKTDQEKNDI